MRGKAAGQSRVRVSGSVLKFDGFLKIADPRAALAGPAKATESSDGENEGADTALPAMKQGEALDLLEVLPERKFTEPPPRFNEASLVKELEERGIGRPSTYSAIITSIQDRGYVVKHERRFSPT